MIQILLTIEEMTRNDLEVVDIRASSMATNPTRREIITSAALREAIAKACKDTGKEQGAVVIVDPKEAKGN